MKGIPTIAVGLTVLLAACGGGTESTVDEAQSLPPDVQVPEFVTQAAQVANQIAADPASYADILESHGLTVEAFENQLYEIAQEPAFSEAFEEFRDSTS